MRDSSGTVFISSSKAAKSRRVNLRQMRIPRKDPAAVLPGADGILVEPAPDGAVADSGHQARVPRLVSHVSHTKAGERNLERGGQLTGQGFYLHNQIWGGKPGDAPGAAARPAPTGVLQRTFFAIG